ncbi:TPA: hypothetical protein ACTZ5S_005476 [Bacillus cereus]|uniref:hypothetical protein n=1 Tax=Bacillus cereus group TaxID=86661 RepID=UPI001F5AEECE|nr:MULTISPECIES: hypothetical protein [Bacillus cereus group]MCR6464879.1 hypothetical protein [Bacillus paranthracis]MCR9018510.1 hypothetical protein [Bacillus paranthracis]MDX5917408.1 hypothetical protein [Bacillus cereus group sp. BfR-BA-01026]
MNLLSFMRNAVKNIGGTEGELCDGFQFTMEQWSVLKKKSKTAENGVIYAFAVKLEDAKKIDLINEASKLKTLNEGSRKNKAVFGDYYLLYWGKSNVINGRGQAHVKGHENGNLHLNVYECLKDCPMEYAFIYVENYKKIEDELIKNYPPMLKTFSIEKWREQK